MDEMTKYNFSIEDIVDYKDDEDPELAIMKVNFLSTKENSHKINITKEILKRDASTILGKFLIGKMDLLNTDVKSHEVDQNIFGYFPKDQEVQFTEDGEEVIASANAVVSKLYATKFYQLFLDDNFRNASVEMMVSNEQEQDDGTIKIDGFNLTGCTVLGKTINGSCPDANVEIIQFSEESASKFYASYKDKKENEHMAEKTTVKQFAVNLRDVWNLVSRKLDEQFPAYEGAHYTNYDIYGIYEESNQKFAIIYDYSKKGVIYRIDFEFTDTDEIKLNDSMTRVKLKFVPLEDDTVVSFEKPESFKQLKDKKQDDDDSNDDDDDDKDDDNKDDNNDDKEEGANKMSEVKVTEPNTVEDNSKKFEIEKEELEKSLKETETKLSDAEKELEELKTFKEDAIKQKREAFVSNFLDTIKGKVEDEEYAKFEEESKTCEFEELENWSNGILADIAKNMFKMEEKKDTHLDMKIDKFEEKKSESLWDRV